MTTPTAPKYRTTTQACSCLGFWYRRSCRHIIAYREAVALVLAQDGFNLAGIQKEGAGTRLCVALRAMFPSRNGCHLEDE